MAEFKLKDINIGCADGESEASENENFKDMFYTDNNKYSQIMNSKNKFIISGRKGTGKTILAKYIQAMHHCKENNKIVSYVKLPIELKQEEIIERDIREVKSDEYPLFIKFFLLKTIANEILNNRVKISMKQFSDFIKYYRSFLFVKKLFTNRYPHGNLIAESAVSEYKASNKKLAFGQKTNKKIKSFGAIINELEKHICICLKYLNVILILDDLDDMKTNLNKESDIKSFLANLINITRDLNIKISSESSFNKCIILIRDDILESLNSIDSNLNKRVVDAEVTLNWMNDKDELISMLCNKIYNSNSEFSGLNKYNILDLFIKNKEQEQIIKAILEKGFGRPRDLIMYFNFIIDKYGNQNNFSFNEIKSVLPDFSRKFWGELKNELSFYHSSNYIDSIEEMLIAFGKKNFTFEELEEFAGNHLDEYECCVDISKAVEIMYSFGIIGNIRQSNKFISFAFRPDGRKHVNKHERLTIHYGLRRAFNV